MNILLLIKKKASSCKKRLGHDNIMHPHLPERFVSAGIGTEKPTEPDEIAPPRASFTQSERLPELHRAGPSTPLDEYSKIPNFKIQISTVGNKLYQL
jgi:hypothetical protein